MIYPFYSSIQKNKPSLSAISRKVYRKSKSYAFANDLYLYFIQLLNRKY